MFHPFGAVRPLSRLRSLAGEGWGGSASAVAMNENNIELECAPLEGISLLLLR
ncbi:MAG: hypothetical protein QOJ15_6435 [Bradyrhizobium sp.]|nr:hypothetical protein [Bradyrhizobium sp.]